MLDTLSALERKAYAFQTEARGLRNRDDLLKAFRRLVPFYRCRLAAWLPEDRDARILDCPSGYGNLSYALAKMGYRCVDSVDIDPAQVELARLVGVEAQVAEGFAWVSARPATYDGVVSLDFLEHLDRPDAVAFCEAVFECLRPDGVMILRTPCADAPFFGTAAFNDLTHRWVATSGVLRTLLEMVGFVGVRVVDDGPVPYKFVNRVRRIAYEATRRLGSAWGAMTGLGAPAIWTPNMWAIARKP